MEILLSPPYYEGDDGLGRVLYVEAAIQVLNFSPD